MHTSLDLNIILKDLHILKDYTKTDCEIVITRFNESLDWALPLDHIVTVYNKGPTTLNFSTVVNISNFGMGLETTLRHIIERYDSLSKMTFFCQGNIADRVDQPLYPLTYYLANPNVNEIRCFKTDDYNRPSYRYTDSISNSTCETLYKNFGEFRKNVVKIPLKPYNHYWVRGDWICVGRNLIRRHPKKYYEDLYNACKFTRGIAVEELWFLERSLYSIFTNNSSAAKA